MKQTSTKNQQRFILSKKYVNLLIGKLRLCLRILLSSEWFQKFYLMQILKFLNVFNYVIFLLLSCTFFLN